MREIIIKKYEYKKVYQEGFKIDLPTEDTYWFETGIRRSVRLIPIKIESNVEDNRIIDTIGYKVTCVYRSFSCKIDQFNIYFDEFEELYNSPNNESSNKKDIIISILEGWLDERTMEEFNNDLNLTIDEIQTL